MENSVIKIENWWIKYNQLHYCIGDCQKFVRNYLFIGQLATEEMGCYNYIYMCKNCIEKFKYTSIENENYCIEGYCIGECEQVVENCVSIGKFYDKNVYMCKNCIEKEFYSDCSQSQASQASQDYCYKCNDYGRCYDCQPFNPVFDTWGLPRGFSRMSREELKKYGL